MDVLTPTTLDEALRLKADHPGALPVQGGTDVMVALNFDRSRPEAMLNLNEVAELRGFARESGSLRLGSGLTYAGANTIRELQRKLNYVLVSPAGRVESLPHKLLG